MFPYVSKGTHIIYTYFGAQCRKRRLKVAVVGVPKTIDNDILLMDKTFGFDTAVEEAQRAINSAYIEVELLNLIAFMFVLSHALSLWYNQIRITF